MWPRDDPALEQLLSAFCDELPEDVSDSIGEIYESHQLDADDHGAGSVCARDLLSDPALRSPLGQQLRQELLIWVNTYADGMPDQLRLVFWIV